MTFAFRMTLESAFGAHAYCAVPGLIFPLQEGIHVAILRLPGRASESPTQGAAGPQAHTHQLHGPWQVSLFILPTCIRLLYCDQLSS